MNVLLRISCCLLLLRSFLPEQLNAQQENLRFEHITVADGLPGTGILDILQDRQGYLWIGTYAGLVRYDGYGFTYFNPDPSDSTAVTDGPVLALFEDHTGTLWVGTCDDLNSGLNRYDRATEGFTRYVENPDDPASLGGSCVSYVVEDQLGYLWVATIDGGVSRLQLDHPEKGFTRFRHDPDDAASLSSNRVSVVYADRSGTIWVGTSNGLSRFDRETERFTRFMYDATRPENREIDLENLEPALEDLNAYPPKAVHALLEDHTGVLWVETIGNGLCRFNQEAGTLTCYRHRPGDPDTIDDDIVCAVAEDLSGAVWIGTRSGLNRFDRETETVTHYQQGARQFVLSLKTG
jgi:ligand-binding sensor domain-containing protein